MMKKLILSIVSIAIAIIALGTSTFAWFTLSNRTTVGQFNAEVTGGDGLEISLDNTSWYSSIPSSVMQDHLATLYGSSLSGDKPIIKDVTSFDGKTFKIFNDDAEDGWIEFDLKFRSRVKTEVYWTNAELGGTTFNWTPDNEFLLEGGVQASPSNPVSINPSNALRVSLDGKVDNVSTVYAYEKANADDGNVYLGTTPSIYGSVSYYNAKNGIGSIEPTDFPTNLFDTFTSFSSTTIDNNKVLTLVENETTSYNEGTITVRVWMEGWDADTYDSILGKPVSIALSFATPES